MENDISTEIICSGEKLLLTSLKAVYWPAQKTLVLADLHLGKSAYFRKSGIAIPSTVMVDDLKRLSVLLSSYDVDKMIVTGDMFHHSYNADIFIFREWREKYPGLSIELVPGNHDKLLAIDYEELGIDVTLAQHFIGPFIFEHEATATNQYFTISGHLHPGYLIEGKARQAMRLPCFIKSEKQLILPAFSAFTGLYTNYEKIENTNYFVVGGSKIFCM